MAATVGDAALGAMLGTFIGDALGMPWEGEPRESTPQPLEMQEARLGRGTYTDDTQMMIAVAESMLRCDAVDPEDLARTFVAAFEPARGYGKGTRTVLELIERGVPVALAPQRLFGGQGSLGNGAAMRVAPVAVRFYEDQVLVSTQARRSARVTHSHPVGIDAAGVQAAAIAAAIDGDDVLTIALGAASTPELRRALEDAETRTRPGLRPETLSPDPGGIPPNGHESVAAAVCAATRSESITEALTVAIAAGGDTDTVGAMTGAIAGARFGAAAIPEGWIEALEDAERGRSHVQSLAKQLCERAQSPVVSSPRPTY